MSPKCAQTPLLLLAAIVLPLSSQAKAKIYTWVDSQGISHYTDVPENTLYRLLVMSSNETARSGERYDPQVLARSSRYDSIIERAADSTAVEPNLLRAVIVVESGFNSNAKSRTGAMGLMQLMPGTATRYGASNPFDPRQNVFAGAQYLKFLLNRFGHNVKLALAAYNAGEGAVDRNGGQIPPYAETQAYVPRVLKIYRFLADQSRST